MLADWGLSLSVSLPVDLIARVGCSSAHLLNPQFNLYATLVSAQL